MLSVQNKQMICLFEFARTGEDIKRESQNMFSSKQIIYLVGVGLFSLFSLTLKQKSTLYAYRRLIIGPTIYDSGLLGSLSL